MWSGTTMKKLVGILLTIIIAVSVGSCSVGQDQSPLMPGGQTVESSDGPTLLGSYRVRIDLTSESIEVVPFRISEKHYNVTAFLFPPTCLDCFQISVQEIDWLNRELTADVTIKNFTSALTGYDVRGIVYPLGDYSLLNAHAYTLLYASISVEAPAGFRAYETVDPDRAMGPMESSTERYVIGFPDGAGFIDLVYAIDASWPDHCPEPYEITDFIQNPLDMNPGSSAAVTVFVFDWQENTSNVTIDTGIMGGSEINLNHWGDEIWQGNVENVLGLPPGNYPVMITGFDSDTYNHLFQWVELKITDMSDDEPPVWDADVGIISVAGGLGGALLRYGTASDPNEPVTYNLYWSDTSPIDFDTANVLNGIESSPYLLEPMMPGEYFFCVRAVDFIGNETTNIAETSAVVGGERLRGWICIGRDVLGAWRKLYGYDVRLC